MFYIHIIFVQCAAWGSFAWFPGGTIRPRVCGHGAFHGDFLAGELGEIFVFFAVAVTIFCICQYVCYLFTYYYYYHYYYYNYYYNYYLVGVN